GQEGRRQSEGRVGRRRLRGGLSAHSQQALPVRHGARAAEHAGLADRRRTQPRVRQGAVVGLCAQGAPGHGRERGQGRRPEEPLRPRQRLSQALHGHLGQVTSIGRLLGLMMKRKTFLAALGAGTLLAATGVVRAQTTRLRLAHAGAETASQHLAALEFARLVKERSQGALELQVYPSSQLGNDGTVTGGVRGGTIDMTMAGSVNFTGLAPRIGALDLPFLFRSPEHAYKTLDGTVGAQLTKELEGHGLKGLSWFQVGFRCITTKSRAVRTPDDVKGLKIRTTPNPSHILAFKLLGANPVPMPLGELYQALESGAVDAQE